MLPICNHAATALFIFIYNFEFSIAVVNNSKPLIAEETTEVISVTTEVLGKYQIVSLP